MATKKGSSSASGSLLELIMIVAVALGLALGIQAFLVKPYRIPSESMVPTLQIGQRVLVNRIGARFSTPDVGDVVVFHPPAGAEQDNTCGSTTAASSSTSSSDALRVGRVGRPHGLDGSFYVLEPAPELPPSDGFVIVEGVSRRIVRRSGTTERPILRFEGASSRDDADALRGAELTVPRSDDMLEEGEFWARDLEGCAVFDGSVAIGFVRRMSALPSVEVLEVDRPDGSELLVPLVRDCIRSIDIEARRIDIDLSFLGEG